MVRGTPWKQANSVGCSFSLRDRNMIRCACGDSYVEHDVYIDEQKGGAQKGARGMRRGARGIKGAGDTAGRGGYGGVSE